ncbi:phosphate-regulating neutral endopeptidase PHEX-like [Haemaphysalis longicornis]
MLRVLLPSPTDRSVRAAMQWSPVALTKLDGLRACLRAQSARRTKPTRLGWGPEQEQLVESAALGPARDVFRTYAERLVGKDHVAQPTYDATRTSREWDQAFYLLYAHSVCEIGAHGRRLTHHTPRWKNVNGQLSNDWAFQRAFECRTGDPMRLGKTCSLWEPSH